jgi:hypothetical protein
VGVPPAGSVIAFPPGPACAAPAGTENGAPRWRVSELPDVITRRGVTVDDASGCWRVSGYHDRDGYARIGGENVARIAWRALVGEIPADRPGIDYVAHRG